MKIQLEDDVIQHVHAGEGPIELVDGAGRTIGIVRRPPTESEIVRARMRTSQGGTTISWEQLKEKLKLILGSNVRYTPKRS